MVWESFQRNADFMNVQPTTALVMPEFEDGLVGCATSNGSIGYEFVICRGPSSSVNDFYHVWAHIVCGVLTS